MKLPIEWYPGPDNKKVFIRRVTDAHLLNAIRYFARRREELHELSGRCLASAGAGCGEMSDYYGQQDSRIAGDQAMVAGFILDALHAERKDRRLRNPLEERTSQ